MDLDSVQRCPGVRRRCFVVRRSNGCGIRRRAPLSLTGSSIMLSNQIARFMLSKGIRKGDRIALSLEKSPTAYALILAALKVGAIYVALDPRNPAARRESILASVHARACSLSIAGLIRDNQDLLRCHVRKSWEPPAILRDVFNRRRRYRSARLQVPMPPTSCLPRAQPARPKAP